MSSFLHCRYHSVVTASTTGLEELFPWYDPTKEPVDLSIPISDFHPENDPSMERLEAKLERINAGSMHDQ